MQPGDYYILDAHARGVCQVVRHGRVLFLDVDGVMARVGELAAQIKPGS